MITFTPGYFGWLGNQMFQYAATFAAAKRVNSWCGFPENEPNIFDIFNLTAIPTNKSLDRLYKEPYFHYNPIPEENDITLHGYFQSEKYFEDYEEEIRKEFSFKKKVREIEPGTVSIHVRRGDYTYLQNYHPLCSLHYYNKAMELFPGHKFLVFSDDIAWCHKNINGPNVSYSEEASPEEDLQLMSKCSHHIIANSSFSWWGAWLNPDPYKTVVVPSVWFGKSKPLVTKDIYCEGWKVI